MSQRSNGGLKFWSFDVGLFRDKKIKRIKGEFGIKGVMIFIYVLNAIYETKGYYLEWTEDDCYLMSEDIGDGCKADLIKQVIDRCIKRSLFDERVFNMFGVLTSASIQRRYLVAATRNRNAIPFIQEYWLLDENNPEDVSPGVLDKITFFSKHHTETPQNRTETPQNRTETPTNNNTEKKAKENNTSCSEQNKSAHEPIIFLPLSDGTFYAIYQKDIELWEDSYPKVTVFLELKKMISWFDANPKKKKTKQGIRRCVNGWMARCQEKGGSSDYAPTKNDSVDYTDIGRYAGEKEGNPDEF